MGHPAVQILLIWAILIQLGNAVGIREKIATLMQNISRNYNKHEPPSLDQPTEVKIGLYANSIHSIDSEAMEMSILLYMRQSWTDARLQFNPDDINGEDTLFVDQYLDGIWKPDLFFRNAKRASFLDVPTVQKITRLSSDGSVWYLATISAVISCPMKLESYPFDKQQCFIIFESYGYTMDTMYLTWLPSPSDIDPGVALPEFRLEDRILYDCSQNYTAGSFTCLQMTFNLKREVTYYLCQYYLPSVFIVILSWLGFWIRPGETTARLIPGVLLLIILLYIFNMARARLGWITYVTAMDVWMLACFTMTFLTLLEFGVIYYLHKRNGENQIKKLRARSKEQHCAQVEAYQASRLDRACRVLFPLAFIVFNGIYWSQYTREEHKEEHDVLEKWTCTVDEGLYRCILA